MPRMMKIIIIIIIIKHFNSFYQRNIMNQIIISDKSSLIKYINPPFLKLFRDYIIKQKDADLNLLLECTKMKPNDPISQFLKAEQLRRHKKYKPAYKILEELVHKVKCPRRIYA